MMNGFLILAGILLLTAGGEAVVKGALAAARRAGVSPLLAGIVIVGIGTSSPELVVSVNAALTGQPDIAVGNVVGSNISNVMLILGLSALVLPLLTTRAALMRDGMAMIAGSCLMVALMAGGYLGRLDALLLLLALAAYLVWAYRTERVMPEAEQASAVSASPAFPGGIPGIIIALLGGLGLLIAGSRLLLEGAVAVALGFGVSEAVIGLTLVAVGTSLPELAVCLLAVIRRQADVAVGNILGSNIFNVLGILGVAAFLQPLEMARRIVIFDQWVMLGSSALLLLILFSGLRINRLEAAVLLAGYIAYIAVTFAGPF
ncbi:calcium/sodium antiporter [Methylonatrum kenyense]|uniref:calcium/sodium antiporter n=1 Tax=Methylonatrum kenyense TaxID=455253 RepID=UPI0020BF0078|nr:calcium/sodium antiporter [Methylonatrum kenyense]MCK8516936.1 calcium/sodium antiporter [Methylonatrum kenyense]